jgi:hypothetical protein
MKATTTTEVRAVTIEHPKYGDRYVVCGPCAERAIKTQGYILSENQSYGCSLPTEEQESYFLEEATICDECESPLWDY